MKTYRFSALASSFVRMWRGWSVVLIVVIVNALLQALLIWPPFTYESGVWTTISAIIGGIVMWIAYGLVAANALTVAEGKVSLREAFSTLRSNLSRYLVWSIVWFVAVAVGMALYVVPGVVVIAITPFLALAALDGQRNPLKVNFQVLGRRWGRWLITTVIVVLVLTLAWNISGFTAFFLRGPLATTVIWIVGGWLLAWFLTAYGLIYRSAMNTPDSANT